MVQTKRVSIAYIAHTNLYIVFVKRSTLYIVFDNFGKRGFCEVVRLIEL